jgi:predicted enzyme related to lactoylglutathione lyase
VPEFQGPDIPLVVAATIDCNDLESQAEFWSTLLGVEVVEITPEFAFLAYAPDRKTTVWLQRVPEQKQGKNRVHLDFAVPDLPAAERRVVALGGSLGDLQEWEGYVWRTCHDPEGNEFDVMAMPTNE